MGTGLVCACECRYLWRPEGGTGFPRAPVTSSSEPQQTPVVLAELKASRYSLNH